MVKLPDIEEREIVERYPRRRNHHNWGARLGRRTQWFNPEPKGLHELEEQTKRIVQLMEKHSPKSEHNYEKAMDLLRLQYNMNFIIVCEKCHGLHVNDEILAPER